jgi:DNA-binding NtrC family response regulator
MALHGKLLRVLQGEEVRPLGGRHAIKLNIRFIAATNHDLHAMVEARKFREDLFYRLNVVPIRVPPLRERSEDIALLARHFIELYSRKEGREPLKTSNAVWRWMNQHTWPGNIRELENLCQRAVALTDGDTFDTDVLALTTPPHRQFPREAYSTLSGTPPDNEPQSEYLAAHASLDYQLLQRALAEHAGNISRAAKSLSISRTTFYARLRKYRMPSAM